MVCRSDCQDLFQFYNDIAIRYFAFAIRTDERVIFQCHVDNLAPASVPA